ncbi:lipoprotein [Paenibacillus illinoisensis]|uniref:Lipoprotein n=1 Tax=Paenibacillus illinoisensis TaxID=59845 RepID=A0ABW8HXD9_9BACL
MPSPMRKMIFLIFFVSTLTACTAWA